MKESVQSKEIAAPESQGTCLQYQMIGDKPPVVK
jgi:hypothetical protein